MLNRQQIAARIALELQNGESVYLDPSWSAQVLAALAPSVLVQVVHEQAGTVDVAVIAATAVAHSGEFSSEPVLVEAKRTVAVLEQHDADDGSKNVVKVLAPVAGSTQRSAQRVITNLAVFDVTPDGLVMHEVAPGISGRDVQLRSDALLLAADDLRVVHV